ncbi:hypothetical protein AK812_SmicGene30735 [Symbiodinium microadriaticum]|uniref:Uncharacterized protein n=1 Tax=Symbiodinium microadriaticum TaxID=2951 RepID=A0A1Q9CYJ3_SYMMI|nr:hypothetical protein AK812_SmicGene30735 [Symbiodinium microadriaticum]
MKVSMWLFFLAKDARSIELDARGEGARHREGCGSGREPERSRADWEAWEREEEAEHRKAGRAYHPIPSVEVLQLLGEVPPGLSGRYCSRLRAEAQRRRASAVSEGSGGLMRRWLLLAVVFLLLPDTASRQRSLAASLAAELSSALPFREIEFTAAEPSALESADSASTARTARSRAEFDEDRGAEDEAISLEVLSRRDILGYHQMLLAIHELRQRIRLDIHLAIQRGSCLRCSFRHRRRMPGGRKQQVLGLGEEAPERFLGLLAPARRDCQGCQGPLDPERLRPPRGRRCQQQLRGLRRKSSSELTHMPELHANSSSSLWGMADAKGAFPECSGLGVALPAGRRSRLVFEVTGIPKEEKFAQVGIARVGADEADALQEAAESKLSVFTPLLDAICWTSCGDIQVRWPTDEGSSNVLLHTVPAGTDADPAAGNYSVKSGGPDERCWTLDWSLAPNASFSEFEQTEFEPNFGVGWGQTDFKLQRFRTPNFGVGHIFGVSLGADRI